MIWFIWAPLCFLKALNQAAQLQRTENKFEEKSDDVSPAVTTATTNDQSEESIYLVLPTDLLSGPWCLRVTHC